MALFFHQTVSSCHELTRPPPSASIKLICIFRNSWLRARSVGQMSPEGPSGPLSDETRGPPCTLLLYPFTITMRCSETK